MWASHLGFTPEVEFTFSTKVSAQTFCLERCKNAKPYGWTDQQESQSTDQSDKREEG